MPDPGRRQDARCYDYAPYCRPVMRLQSSSAQRWRPDSWRLLTEKAGGGGSPATRSAQARIHATRWLAKWPVRPQQRVGGGHRLAPAVDVRRKVVLRAIGGICALVAR